MVRGKNRRAPDRVRRTRPGGFVIYIYIYDIDIYGPYNSFLCSHNSDLEHLILYQSEKSTYHTWIGWDNVDVRS